MAVKYFYLGDTAPQVETATQFEQLQGAKNPLTQLDQEFIDRLQGLSSVEMAKAVPYISIQRVGLDGQIREDLNIGFFHKPIDMENINSGMRYAERPLMSIKDVEVSTTLASGYIKWTNVTVNIKIHAPHALQETSLLSFLVPGMPHLLTYGWNHPDPDSPLNEKEVLLFSVVDYDLNMDGTGQVDLSVRGMAYNDHFNNTYLGDVGRKVETSLVSNQQSDSINNKVEMVKKTEQFLDDAAKNQNKNSINTEIIDVFKTSTDRSTERKVRADIIENFAQKIKALDDLATDATFGKYKNIRTVKFHDLFFTLCNDTLVALQDLFPAADIKIMYGNFNEKAPPYAEKSVAEFPIHLRRFKSKFKNQIENGSLTLTVEQLLNILVGDFFMNPDYYDSGSELFNNPEIVINFFNTNQSMECLIADIKNKLPITASKIRKGKTTIADMERDIVENSGLPIIRIGHAQSFIKNVSFSQITDSYMKSALIARMNQDRITNPASTIAPKEALNDSAADPIHLPFQGTGNFLGHVRWKPFKAFYLSSGMYILDAVYVIENVKHTLSSGEFATTVEFRYH